MCSTCAIPSAPSGPVRADDELGAAEAALGRQVERSAQRPRVGDVEPVTLDHLDATKDTRLATVRPASRVAEPLRVSRPAGDVEPVRVLAAVLVDQRQVAARETACPLLVPQRVAHRPDPHGRTAGTVEPAVAIEHGPLDVLVAVEEPDDIPALERNPES